MSDGSEAPGGEGGKVFCDNLDPATTVQELHQLFASVGPCTAVLRRAGGEHPSYGHIFYCTEQDAAAAVERLHGAVLRGRRLQVKPHALAGTAPAGTACREGAAGAEAEAPGDSVPLPGLASQADPRHLQDSGGAHGPVPHAGVGPPAESGAGPSAGPIQQGVFYSFKGGTGKTTSSLRVPAFADAASIARHAMAAWQGERELARESMIAEMARRLRLREQPQEQQPMPRQEAEQRQQAQQAQHGRGHAASRRKPPPKPAVVVRGLSAATTADTLGQVFGAVGGIRRLRLVTNDAGVSAGVAFITFFSQEAMRAAVALGQGLEIDGHRPTVQSALRDLPPESQEPPAAPPAEPDSEPGLSGPAAPAQGASQQPLGAAYQRAQQQQQQWQQQQPGPAEPRPRLHAGAPPAAAAQQQQHQAQFRASRSSSASSLQSTSAGQLPRPPSVPGMAGPSGGPQPTLAAYPAAAAGFIPLPEVDEGTLRQHFGPHAGVVSVRVLRRPDGTKRGCGFVRFASPDQAHLALQGMDGTSLAGRTLRLTWAWHGRPAHHAIPGWDWAVDPGPAPYAEYDATRSMLPVMAAASGYPGAVMVPAFYYPAAYGSPLPTSPMGLPTPLAFGMVPVQQAMAAADYARQSGVAQPGQPPAWQQQEQQPPLQRQQQQVQWLYPAAGPAPYAAGWGGGGSWHGQPGAPADGYQPDRTGRAQLPAAVAYPAGPTQRQAPPGHAAVARPVVPAGRQHQQGQALGSYLEFLQSTETSHQQHQRYREELCTGSRPQQYPSSVAFFYACMAPALQSGAGMHSPSPAAAGPGPSSSTASPAPMSAQ
ncbi:hypothetical protein ABPG75_011798 [Micractinium tetrahymenae]